MVWAAWRAPKQAAADGTEALLQSHDTSLHGGLNGSGGLHDGLNGSSAVAAAMGGTGGVGGGMGRRTQSLQWLNAATEVRVAGGRRGGRGKQLRENGVHYCFRCAAQCAGVCIAPCMCSYMCHFACCHACLLSILGNPSVSPHAVHHCAGGGRRFSQRQVEEVKLVLRLLPVFATTSLYWTIYMQVCCACCAGCGRAVGHFVCTLYTLWSRCACVPHLQLSLRWTAGRLRHGVPPLQLLTSLSLSSVQMGSFFVAQGVKMDRTLPLPGGGSFLVPAASLA